MLENWKVEFKICILQKLIATKQGGPEPSTSRQAERAASPKEASEEDESSDEPAEEVVKQTKVPPKKLPNHPALVTLPKRRLFKHKDVLSGK